MKNTLILMFCLFSMSAFSQVIPTDWTMEKWRIPFVVGEEGLIEYSEVVEVEGKTAAQLYSLARQWISENYKSGKDVVQMDDKELGILDMKGYSVVTAPAAFGATLDLWYRIKFQFKDGRYKYTFHQFEVGYAASQYSSAKEVPLETTKFHKKKSFPKPARQFKEDMLDKMQGIIDGFKGAMAAEKEADDW